MNPNNSTRIYRRLRNLPQKGFTLLEIVIAMLILSLTVAGMFTLFSTNYKFIIEAEHRLQAINYARMVAESLKVYVTADPGTTAITGTPNGASIAWAGPNPVTALNLPDPNTIITNVGTPVPTCTYTVTDDPQGAIGLKEVIIRETWTEL